MLVNYSAIGAVLWQCLKTVCLKGVATNFSQLFMSHHNCHIAMVSYIWAIYDHTYWIQCYRYRSSKQTENRLMAFSHIIISNTHGAFNASVLYKPQTRTNCTQNFIICCSFFKTGFLNCEQQWKKPTVQLDPFKIPAK